MEADVALRVASCPLPTCPVSEVLKTTGCAIHPPRRPRELAPMGTQFRLIACLWSRGVSGPRRSLEGPPVCVRGARGRSLSELGVSDTLAAVLVRRGLAEPGAARGFPGGLGGAPSVALRGYRRRRGADPAPRRRRQPHRRARRLRRRWRRAPPRSWSARSGASERRRPPDPEPHGRRLWALVRDDRRPPRAGHSAGDHDRLRDRRRRRGHARTCARHGRRRDRSSPARRCAAGVSGRSPGCV